MKGIAEIKLSQNLFAIIDKEDFEFLNKWKWHAFRKDKNSSYYAIRTDYSNGKKSIRMHRLLFEKYNQIDVIEVDHIDGNGLNNTKQNLRHCNRSENCMNRKPFGLIKLKGVDKKQGLFRARITVNKKTIFLGYFETKEMAADAYNNAAIKYHKDFKRLNP